MWSKEKIREVLEPALMLAMMAASFTKTQKDDHAVDLLKKILASDQIMDAVVLLLTPETPITPPTM